MWSIRKEVWTKWNQNKKEINCKGHKAFGFRKIFYITIDMIFMYLVKYSTHISQNVLICSVKSIHFLHFNYTLIK